LNIIKVLLLKRNYALFLIVPIFLTILFLFLSSVRGPYYLGKNSDPEYAYLFNSLRIVESKVPFHIDHPGTTLQMMGAGIISVSNLGRNPEVIVQRVLANPEKYLNYFSVGLFFILVIVDVFVGFYAYRISKNIVESIILQIVPLLSIQPILELYRVRPDNLLIPIALLFTLIIYRTLYRPINIRNEKKYIVIWAILCGFALVTKINFAPMLIIPLLTIPGIKNKVKLIVYTVISFVFFSSPIIPVYPRFFAWVTNLASHSERYGSGDQNIVNLDSFFANMIDIFRTEVFMSVVIVVITLIIVFILIKQVQKNIKINNLFIDYNLKVLISIFIAMVAQIVIVSKHMSFHYLIPALMLIGILVIIIFKSTKEICWYSRSNEISNNTISFSCSIQRFYKL